jgi:hypothetical protein
LGLGPEYDEWLENDDLNFASALAPEMPTVNLDRVLRPKPPTSKLSARAARENLGGDYSRFIPRNPQLFIAGAKKIGPVSHSSVILARSKQVLMEARTHVKEVVGTAAKA